MFKEITNKILKFAAESLRPHLNTAEENQKPLVLEATASTAKQIINRKDYSYGAANVRLTAEKAKELLALSFQRGPEMFQIRQRDGRSCAMDTAADNCPLAIKNMFGMDGVANEIIYTFFARHGFIGWQLCAMLSQHWLINRACRIPNEDALASGWAAEWQKRDTDETEIDEDKRAELLLRAVEVSNQKFKLAEKALRFGINRSIYGQALAYFDIEGEDPATPLNIDGIKPLSFKGIVIVEPYWAFPDWGENAMMPGSLNFYKPEYYTIGGQRIHHTRVCQKPFVEVPDILKPSYYFGGVPLTQMIYERVYAAEKTANEVPELALTKRMLVADANMQDMVANPEAMRYKMEILAHFRNNNGVYFKDRPETVTQLDTNLSDLDANVWTQYQLVASVSSMPADRLLCTSPKGFQSTGEYERRTYAQTLKSSYQEVAYRELIEKTTAIVLKSEFDNSDPITINFNPIDTPTEAERVQTQLAQAQRDTTLVNAGIISAEEAREALSADKGSGYSNLPAEMPKTEGLPDLEDLLGGDKEEGPEGEENGGSGVTDGATEDYDPNQKRGKDGKWTKEGTIETDTTKKEKKHFQSPKKTIGTAEIEGKKLNVYYKAEKNVFFDKLKKAETTKIEPIEEREDLIKILKPLAGHDLTNEETKISAQVNNEQRGKLGSGAAIKKSIKNGFTREEHMGAAAKIAELYKKAILRFEREDDSGDPNVLSIRRFIAPIKVGEKPSYAKLTVKETHTDNKIYKSAYTVELHSLEQVTEGGAGLDNWI